MPELLAASIGMALLFVCVCVYSWARRERSTKRTREQARANYLRDIADEDR